ncbi:MAG: ATP-grasp domain-containing protein [Candidatus Sericytochromatia bacterium]
MHHAQRFLVSVFREAAARQGLLLQVDPSGWLLTLRQPEGKLLGRVLGYVFPLNDAAAAALMKDKVALSGLLAEAGLPHVPHRLVLSPELTDYLGHDGNGPLLDALLADWGLPLVVKPNEGTGGKGVTLVQKRSQLEYALQTLFQQHRALALSPYLDISYEYRVIVLDDRVLLGFGKAKAAGSWKHNLSGGAQAFAVSEGPLLTALSTLARQAVAVLGARVASVDMVATADGLKILELNGGICLEKLATGGDAGLRAQAQSAYLEIFAALAGATTP